MAKQNKPAIRFKGFTDAWEQRKLGKISEIKTGPFGSTLHADDYVSEGVPIITTEHFKTGSLPQSASGLPQVSEVDYKRLSAYTLNNGDIVFSRVGSVDINALVTPFQRNWLFSGRVLRVRPGIDVLPQFLHTRLETESIRNDICARAVGQTMPSINTEILKATQLVLPTSMAEQKQIGLYFAKLDHLITLHQRKYDKLQVLKKAMLEKMFPKNGSSVPEIRFKGFTDAWEQRKAKELCNIGTGKSNTQDQVEDGIYPFYIRSDIPVKSNKYLYDCEAVITIGDGNIGRVFHYVNGKFDLHQRCYKMTDFQDIWGKYFYYFFSTRFYDRAMKMTAKATVDSVRLEMISEMDIWKPTAIDEQKKIAEFFANLDHLITLHQRELEKLQNIKKSMLEKMFV